MRLGLPGAEDLRAGLMPEGPEPVDWQGAAIDCGSCRHRGRLADGLCGPGWACANDRYARRIERFFLLGPDLADEFLSHPYFEARAQAARVANLFRLPPLLDDPDPAVRSVAILRLPALQARRLAADPDRAVRIAVAHRLPPADLHILMRDADPAVRLVVARRADPGLLPVLAADPDPEVRGCVARRIDPARLLPFAADPEPLVRRAAAERVDPARLGAFAEDPDIRVRHAVAERADEPLARRMAADPDPLIRETADLRLAQLREEATDA